MYVCIYIFNHSVHKMITKSDVKRSKRNGKKKSKEKKNVKYAQLNKVLKIKTLSNYIKRSREERKEKDVLIRQKEGDERDNLNVMDRTRCIKIV